MILRERLTIPGTSPIAVKQSLRERGIHKSLIDWIVLLISMRVVTVRSDLINITV